MKNAARLNQGKFKKLTPELTRFIEGMGMFFEEDKGIPRIGGRILGLLMIAHEPLTADDIGQILKVSRASVSTNMRMLTVSGFVERTTPLHDRATYFVFSESALEQSMVFAVQSAARFKKATEQGLAALPAGDSARVRLERSIEWSDLVAQAYQKAITDWRKRYPNGSL
jgi:DNA-binding transcriptional regulator GbsR (MarR family)